MLEKVIEIISEYQGIDSKKITKESDLILDLGLSSFDVISLICKFEEEFSVEIPDRKIKDLKTIGDIKELIQSLE